MGSQPEGSNDCEEANLPQEASSQRQKFCGMDQDQPESEVERVDETVSDEVSGILELLWSDRQHRESEAVLVAKLWAALQVA